MGYIKRHGAVLISLLFAIIVALFWVFPYRCALSFQEQYQLFLLTPSYFSERMSVPGGLADYVAEFIVQFYYLYAIGAILLALVFFCLQRLTWMLMRRCGASHAWYLQSFVPAIALWAYMGNENVLLSFAIALLGMEELMLYALIVRDRCRHWGALPLYLLIAIPAGYWLWGPVVMGICIVPLLPRKEKTAEARPMVTPVGWTVASILYFVAVVFLCGLFLQYPYERLFAGINYFRYPTAVPVAQWVVEALFVFLPLIVSYLPQFENKKAVRVGFVQLLAIILCAVGMLRLGFDRATYELIDYDYLVRTHQWQRIIDKAKRHLLTF